jgi:hypothetical protein
MAFNTKASLLNPKFEGYKLDPVDQDEILFRYPLEYPTTQSTASNTILLSFPEVQSRITHNHLATSPAEGRAVYVDSDYNLILVNADTVSFIKP